jgi:hypothetical protein
MKLFNAPNAQRSAAWTAVPDYIHYTYFSTEEHANEDTKPKSRRLLRRVGRFVFLVRYSACEKNNYETEYSVFYIYFPL